MRDYKFSYIYQHDDTGRIINKIFDIHEIELEQMLNGFIKGYSLVLRRQDTGLKDRNGVSIYEGDILCHPLQGNRFVEYGSPFKNYGGYMLVSKNKMRGTLNDTDKLYEVIGNIYENPELLENKEGN
ncbi:YopX family protein [Aliarcobacter cibarius]|uniref:YopX protein domain-containing protein n=1 Tax=Aliarcobacter cibarius TaxID=255507 RepID=A0ABY2V4Q0_9BACT|nr:YopX family protein [Aliarcobacter cibarius]TLS99932.1 hypothetical protein FE247_05215 [Aliarcobacter cibarius]TLT00341.1 hypothetical protein FE245_05645 [Aliarcobacter cibarius]